MSASLVLETQASAAYMCALAGWMSWTSWYFLTLCNFGKKVKWTELCLMIPQQPHSYSIGLLTLKAFNSELKIMWKPPQVSLLTVLQLQSQVHLQSMSFTAGSPTITFSSPFLFLENTEDTGWIFSICIYTPHIPYPFINYIFVCTSWLLWIVLQFITDGVSLTYWFHFLYLS